VLPVDESVAEAYVTAATALYVDGRSPRPRNFDLLIAATAMANEIPLYTRNFKDVATLRHLVDIRPV
jgi:predicted nucleic acid-binding protein